MMGQTVARQEAAPALWRGRPWCRVMASQASRNNRQRTTEQLAARLHPGMADWSACRARWMSKHSPGGDVGAAPPSREQSLYSVTGHRTSGCGHGMWIQPHRRGLILYPLERGDRAWSMSWVALAMGVGTRTGESDFRRPQWGLPGHKGLHLAQAVATGNEPLQWVDFSNDHKSRARLHQH